MVSVDESAAGQARGGGHTGHSHGIGKNADASWLRIALALIVVFMAGEVVVGIVAHSLALLSDAAHMLTDAFAIVLALWAISLARKPAAGKMTYGWKRAEILSAQANGLTLLLLAGWLAYEAVHRLIEPPEVAGGLVLVTALVGVAVNLAATWAISKANRSSLNVEGAFQHILTDLFAFIATAVAGAVMVLTDYTRADGIATLVVAALMVKSGVMLVRESGRIFLDAAPAGIDPDAVGKRLAAQPSVVEVHDLHIWAITSSEPALSAHVLVVEGADCHAVRVDLEILLAEVWHIDHTTLQVDHVPGDVLRIEPRPGGDHCAEPHGVVHRP